MSKKLKLSPKQLNAVSNLEQQKVQLASMVKEVNEKQSLVVELAFEAAGIDTATVTNIKLEGDSLTYEEVAPAEKPKAKKKSAAVAA